MTALLDWQALIEHGLKGLAKAVMTNGSANAPLVPLLAAPLTAPDPMSTATVLVQIPFVWLLIVSSHSIYRRLAGPWAALVGTIVTVSLPGVLSYARLLHFAVPLTAVLTAALAALLASRYLTSWRWSLVFGLLMGLALLTRTVALAMVPGLIVVAVLLAARRSPARLWIRNLALALAAAAVIAAPWYAANSSVVTAYLLGNGYSEGSSFYVPVAPWMMRLAQIVGQDILIPLIVVGIGVVAVALARRLVRQRGGASATAEAKAVAPIASTAAIAVTLGWYFLALSSSHNGGTAFTLPLAPLLVALVLYLSCQLSRRQAATAAAITLAVVAFNVVAAVIPLGYVGVGDIMGAGDVAIMDGRSASDAQIAQALGTPDATIADPTSLGQELRKANCAIAARGSEGAILLTRPDALLGGIFYCAAGMYGTQPFMASTGCAPTDGACVAAVMAKYGFPTVVTGDARSPYPGHLPEALVLPYLTGYRMVNEIKVAPGMVVHVWARAVH